MIVAKHIGQLGNNLFQIAAAIGYARRYNYEWGVDHGKGLSEPYSKIHECYPNLPKVDMLSGNKFHEHPNAFCREHRVHYNDCHFDFHIFPNMGPQLTMTGFFQSWKYFKDVQEEVRKVFALPHVQGYEDVVSIHVRRGDYVQHAGSFPPIDDKYLNLAIDYFQKLGLKKYLFFSDDIPWCNGYVHRANGKKELGQSIFEFSNRSTLEDFTIMASCGHHIIANSTFSWWAAWLGHNPDRRVVSPSCVRGNWFGLNAGVKKDVVDLLPPEWHQIVFR